MKLLTVVGARPQFVKAAAVSAAVIRWNRRAEGQVEEVLVHTGQHYDPELSAVFFAELPLSTPRYELGVGSATHGAQTGAMMIRLEPIVEAERPDWVVLYGDTNSTLAGALVASKLGVPIAHVEAGLRSYNRHMPEEINRVVTDHLSASLLCPSALAAHNLALEGISSGVDVVGDVMLEMLRATLARIGADNPVAERLAISPSRPYIVATVHRAENTDDEGRFAAIVMALESVASDGFDVVWPAHPRVRDRLSTRQVGTNVHVVDPATYFELLALLRDARAIVTDSGGLQKEALWMGVRCVTLRNETEWVETVDAGWNVLVGTRLDQLGEEVRTAAAAKRDDPPALYGDGNASDRIVELLTSATFGTLR